MPGLDLLAALFKQQARNASPQGERQHLELQQARHSSHASEREDTGQLSRTKELGQPLRYPHMNAHDTE